MLRLTADIDVEGGVATSPKETELELEIAIQDDSETIDVLELSASAGDGATTTVEEQTSQEEAEPSQLGTPVQDDAPATGDHSNEPMELGTPIDSEFDIKFDSHEQNANDSGVKIEPEIAEIEGEDTVKTSSAELAEVKLEMKAEVKVDVKAEKEDMEESPESKSGRSLERLDSSIDPSYQPGSEELLYEGDPENENETEVKTDAIGGGEDEGFIVDLHDRSMDIDVGTKVREDQIIKPEEAGVAEHKGSEKDREQSVEESETRRKPSETPRFVLSLSLLSLQGRFFLSTALTQTSGSAVERIRQT